MRKSGSTPEIQNAGDQRLLARFGLVEAAGEAARRVQRFHVNQVATQWPFACIAQAIAVMLVAILAVQQHLTVLLPDLAGAALLVLLTSGAVWFLLRHPYFERRPGEVHIRALVGCALLSGGTWAAFLDTVQTFPGGWAEAVAIAATVGATGGVAIALSPARAALLAFLTALLAVVSLATSAVLPALVGLLFLIPFGAALHAGAGAEQRMVAGRARLESDGVLAIRLVSQFEAHGSGWFWETDRMGRVTYLSRKIVEEVREKGERVIGTPLTELFQIDGAAPDMERTLSFHLSARTGFSDYPVRPAGQRDGEERWWSISGRPVIDELGQFRGFIGSGSDLSEKRRSEAEITRLALYDGLTGLANRQRMRLMLDQMLARSNGPYRPTSLFLLDLDRFKAVNDTLGHQTGDSLLKQVAQRLQRCIGETGLVGRLGGDEFQVVLPGESRREHLAELARQIVSTLSQPYVIDGTSITIGCSIGIAIAPDDGGDSETLVRNADLALYAAKANGRGVHRFYAPAMLEGAQGRKQMEDDLRHALAQDQLSLVYQPVVATGDERIVGYEALLRWMHPERGPISPAEFIPVAEDCGLIESLGEWVLRTACNDAAHWPADVRVAVNVSPIQFANPALPAIVTNALASAGIAPARLELEITESVFLDDDQSSERMFKQLKDIGVRLALDDFGTGYSSLGYLKKAPFDKIKIDQSFVRGAAVDGSRNAAIIRAIVTLANTLGMETTAEGVEVQDEIALIRSLGCSHIQGYVYGRPLNAEGVAHQLGQSGGAAEPTGVKFSRAPRTTMLRSATLRVGTRERTVRIRNISRTGAMVDCIDMVAVGAQVSVELVEGEFMRAEVRWVEAGRAGLAFAENFDLERLNSAPVQRVRAWR